MYDVAMNITVRPYESDLMVDIEIVTHGRRYAFREVQRQSIFQNAFSVLWERIGERVRDYIDKEERKKPCS